MRIFMNLIGNPFVKLLLHSPLHGLISDSTMLITVTGRKTGKKYTTPINYVRDGDIITVFSKRRRSWWKNLRGGAPVTIRIKRQNLTGQCEIIDEEDEAVACTLQDFYERALPVKLSPEKARETAPAHVIIRIRLTAFG